MTRAEEASLLAYPVKMGLFYEPDHHYEADRNLASRIKFQEGYEQAEKDIIADLKMMLSVTEEGWLNENLNIFIKKWEDEK